MLMLAIGCTAAYAQAARLDVVVFEQGAPVAGIAVSVDDREVGATDDDGTISADLGPGTWSVGLARESVSLGTVEITVAADAPVQLIATLMDGRAAFDVEGASVGAVVLELDEIGEADYGTLRGRITSSETGEAVEGAQLYFSGVETRAATDAAGAFVVRLPAAIYQVSIVHPRFSTLTQGVGVTPGGVARLDLELVPAGLLLDEFTVSAPHVEGSVASVFADVREGSGVTEVLGAEQMSRSGDSDAADALKRVAGLTIEDGRYVVVRGQPYRYTYTLWNGSPLPSPDPIRLVVPLDLFPTGVLSQINIEKSYDAASPGAFGGGLIRLETAGVPEEDFFEFSAKVGGNTQTTGKDGLDYEGGDRDLLGMDDGTRALPAELRPTGLNPTEVTARAAAFPNDWSLRPISVEPDAGLSLGGGMRFDALGGRLGLRGGLDWGRDLRNTEIVRRNFALQGDDSLVVRDDQVEMRTDEDIGLNALLVTALEWDVHSLRSNSFIVRKTTKRSQISEGLRVVSQENRIREHLLEWNERALFAQQFIGAHEFGDIGFDWRAMYAASARDVPDRRNYVYRQRSDGVYIFFNQIGAGRRYSESEDDIASLDADLEYPLIARERWTLDLHAGVSAYRQDRESETRRFTFLLRGLNDLTLPPEELLGPDGLGTSVVVSDQTQTNDTYLGEATVDGVYLKADFDWSERLRVTLGARHERSEYQVETFVSGGVGGGVSVTGGFERGDTLPSLAVTWRFHDTQQLRFTAARSLSRPVLNELSPARYFDPDSGEEFLGNPDLRPALIDSADLRWEWFPSSLEFVSFGVFGRKYTDPIEESFVGVGGSSFLRQIQNAGSATVAGVEASARTDLGRVLSPTGLDNPWLQRIFVQANASVIDSEVELARQDLASSGVRPLQGQADTVFNLQFGYDGERHDVDLSFNRVGERLFVAGVQGQPDVYQQPVAQLDLNYRFALTDTWKLRLSAGNLLDPRLDFLQGPEIYRSYQRGRSLSMTVSGTFE